MKKSLVLIVLVVLVLMAFAVPMVSAENVAFTYNGNPIDLSNHGVGATVHDAIVDTHSTEKNAENRKYYVGFRKPKLLRLTENTYLSTSIGKDMRNTDMSWNGGGWYHSVEVMNNAVGFDARKFIGMLNPFNWFKKK